ncbi:MAG TPA: hypothetical protein VH590_01095 [Ktedonobacterales bacterium]
MLKQHILKLLIGLAILASLIGGVSAESGAAVAKVAPAHHLLACGNGAVGFPPCE